MSPLLLVLVVSPTQLLSTNSPDEPVRFGRNPRFSGSGQLELRSVNSDTMFRTLSQCPNNLQPGSAVMIGFSAPIEFDWPVTPVAGRGLVSVIITSRSG